MREWVYVANLTTTKTLQGGFVARCAPGLPFLLTPGLEVAFVPPLLDVPRRARVESVQMQDLDNALVYFEGIKDADTARALVGCRCLARKSDLSGELSRTGDATSDLSGFEVFDNKFGVIGTLSDIEIMPAQRLLKVERIDSSKSVYIPWVDEFVIAIDDIARRIEVDIPQGLLDL